MPVVILLVGLLVQTCIGNPLFDPTDGGRIIGGERVKLGEIPYINARRMDWNGQREELKKEKLEQSCRKNGTQKILTYICKHGRSTISLKHGSHGSHTCGGSILDETHVLTAAHCVHGRTEDFFQVQYGVIDSTSPDNRINVTKIRMHEGFNPDISTANDVAVLTIAEKMVFGPNAQPTVLPSEPLIIVLEESIDSRLSGWGYTEDELVQQYLLTTTFPLFNDLICLSLLPGFNPLYHTCAGSLDGTHKQCSGDSGGPLYANGTQEGIVSWSVKPCTKKNKPGVFTRVANYVDWIKRAMMED